MVELDIQKINKESPYHISVFDTKGSYVFTTDYGNEYVITFMIDYNLHSDGLYQFVITNSNNPILEKILKQETLLLQ